MGNEEEQKDRTTIDDGSNCQEPAMVDCQELAKCFHM